MVLSFGGIVFQCSSCDLDQPWDMRLPASA